MFTDKQLRVIEFIAKEVERQEDSPLHVYHMAQAWEFATQMDWLVENVNTVGKLVEPFDNPYGFRTLPVTINGEVLDATRIGERVHQLMENYAGEIDYHGDAADDFYREFEAIHPFNDGNGRVGAILYNMLLMRLDDPIVPPKFKD